MTETIDKNIRLRIEQLQRLSMAPEGVVRAQEMMEAALRQGFKLLVFGNGGSATQASHLAAELVNKFYFQRPALPAIALTADMANITSIANDMDYRYIFSRQVQALGQAGDVALGLSTSGKSPNVLEGLRAAKQKKMLTVALCGANSAPALAENTDIVIAIPCHDTPTIQELHLFILHFWAEMLEKNLCASS